MICQGLNTKKNYIKNTCLLYSVFQILKVLLLKRHKIQLPILLFIIASSVLCREVSDSWITKANKTIAIAVEVSKRKASKRIRKYPVGFMYFHIILILISCYLVSKLIKVRLIIRRQEDKTDNKNSAKKNNKVCLKTLSEFYSPSYFQEHAMQRIDGNLLTSCFSNILGKLLQNRQTWTILHRFWQNQSKNKI